MQLFQNKKLTDSALKFILLSPKDKKLALAQAICNNFVAGFILLWILPMKREGELHIAFLTWS